MKDTIYSENFEEVNSFVFNEKVADVFDDMISRSVPLYHEVQEATAAFAARYAAPGSSIFDLGCSTGETLIEVSKHINRSDISIVGIDNSSAMLDKCRAKLSSAGNDPRISIVCDDLTNVRLENASVVILNYTLQFLPVNERQDVLNDIYNSLNDNGILLLTEKVSHSNHDVDEIMIDLHHDFKQRQGYSKLEIARKRTALENVLIPLTLEENVNMLKKAGFSTVETYFKWYNFSSVIAVKS